MENYIISCCSTADLNEAFFKQNDVHYVCFHFTLDGKQYPDDLGKSIPLADFYKSMQSGAETKTSQVNVEEYIDYFTPFLKEGKDILHVSLSSGISGSYNSANIAKDMLLAEYPDRKIYIVDSISASSGYGLLIDRLASLRASGMSIDELHDWAEAHKADVNLFFFSSDLTFFIKGGRISKASGVLGSFLGICPLMNVDEEGKLVVRQKVRGKKKVIKEIVNQMLTHCTDGASYSGKCFISHSACIEDAHAVAELVKSTFPHMSAPIEIFDIGTVIGSHTGPGTVALFFWGNGRSV